MIINDALIRASNVFLTFKAHFLMNKYPKTIKRVRKCEREGSINFTNRFLNLGHECTRFELKLKL